MTIAAKQLLSASADANGTALALSARVEGDTMGIIARGTFGGGTVTIQVSFDGTNWASTDVTFTADGYKELRVVANYVRAVLAGSTSPTVVVEALGSFHDTARTDS